MCNLKADTKAFEEGLRKAHESLRNFPLCLKNVPAETAVAIRDAAITNRHMAPAVHTEITPLPLRIMRWNGEKWVDFSAGPEPDVVVSPPAGGLS